MTTREQVVEEAQTWIGTPFIHQAMVKGAGVGCGTLLIACYSSAGIRVPSMEEIGHFSKQWHLHEREERYLNVMLQYTQPVETPDMGDIVLFRMGRVFAHSGIVVSWPRIIHTHWNHGVEWADSTKPPLYRRDPVFLTPFSPPRTL